MLPGSIIKGGAEDLSLNATDATDNVEEGERK